MGAGHGRRRALLVVTQLAIAIYGGFFGAAMGILMLAMLGLIGQDNLSRMNGLKNFAAVCINGVAAVTFFASGEVHPALAGAMMAGAVAGGYGAARLVDAHRRPLGARPRHRGRPGHGLLHAYQGLVRTPHSGSSPQVVTIGNGFGGVAVGRGVGRLLRGRGVGCVVVTVAIGTMAGAATGAAATGAAATGAAATGM